MWQSKRVPRHLVTPSRFCFTDKHEMLRTAENPDLAIAAKKAKQAHGASIIVEQKLKALRKIQPVRQRTRDEQQRVTDELV